MPHKIEVPERLERAMGADIDVDVSKRILKRAVFVTRNIASDGGIVVPDGISVRFYETNPQVFLIHNRRATNGVTFPVVGRSLNLTRTDQGMESETQFADDPDGVGRQIAYLYGVNEDKEVYSRGWSFGWETLERETWTLDHAKQWLGKDWDEELVPDFAKRWDEVWVALRSQMNEYSVVPLGADKLSLSRAFEQKGIEIAGDMVARMDLTEAHHELESIRNKIATEEVRRLTLGVQALLRDGAAAAKRGDSAAILAEIKELTKLAKGE